MVAAHQLAQRGEHHALALERALAGEGGRHDAQLEVVAVRDHLDLRARNRSLHCRLDARHDLLGWSGDLERHQYLGTVESTSVDQASMPPSRLCTLRKPSPANS